MKNIITVLFASALITTLVSCASSNRATSTIDDVYYSPARAVQERIATRNLRDDGDDADEYYYSDKARMQMRLQDYRWRLLDDDDMYYSSRFGTYYDPYMYGAFYSPYYAYSPFSYGFGGFYPGVYYNSFFPGLYLSSTYYSPYYGGLGYYPSYTVKPALLKPFNTAAYRANLGAYREAYRSFVPNNYQRNVQVYRSNNNIERVNSDYRINNNQSYNNNRSYSPAPTYSPPASSGSSISRPSRN